MGFGSRRSVLFFFTTVGTSPPIRFSRFSAFSAHFPSSAHWTSLGLSAARWLFPFSRTFAKFRMYEWLYSQLHSWLHSWLQSNRVRAVGRAAQPGAQPAAQPAPPAAHAGFVGSRYWVCHQLEYQLSWAAELRPFSA